MKLTLRERITLDAYMAPDRPTQAALAIRFGVTQGAIALRIKSARAKLYARAATPPTSKPLKLKPISLSLCYNV